MKAQTVRAAAVAVTLAAETTVLSGIPAAGGNSSAQISQTITGVINMIAGTGTTAVVVKCKTSGGTQVGISETDTLAAGASENIPFVFVDQTGVPTASYQITVTQTGGTANGTVNDITAYCIGEG